MGVDFYSLQHNSRTTSDFMKSAEPEQAKPLTTIQSLEDYGKDIRDKVTRALNSSVSHDIHDAIISNHDKAKPPHVTTNSHHIQITSHEKLCSRSIFICW